MDASLLLLAEVGFLDANDRRFAATVAAVEKTCVVATSSSAMSRRTISANRECLHRLQLLVRQCPRRARSPRRGAPTVRKAARLSQPPRPAGGTHRSRQRRAVGNFVQTYSMVGLINAAFVSRSAGTRPSSFASVPGRTGCRSTRRSSNCIEGSIHLRRDCLNARMSQSALDSQSIVFDPDGVGITDLDKRVFFGILVYECARNRKHAHLFPAEGGIKAASSNSPTTETFSRC